jgi:hypothetical protein
LGHLLFANTQDLGTSLDACVKIGGNHRETCYQGVFMEAAGAESSFGHAPILSKTPNNYEFPCNTIEAQFQHACFLYLPQFQQQAFNAASIPNASRLGMTIDSCMAIKDARNRSDCFMGLGFHLDRSAAAGQKLQRIGATTCSSLSGTDRTSCVLGLTLRYATADRYTEALQYCATNLSPGEKNICYDASFQIMSRADVTDSGIMANCTALPSSGECLDAYARYKKVSSTLPLYMEKGLPL